jgi:2'-5' RNA ligase
MELTTAIIIVAPHEVQAIAVPLLQRYAPDTSVRVPAHITVLFPFVLFERLAEASTKLREICAPIAPFDITMQGYDSFPSVAFMNPVNPAPIQAVFRKIYVAFPECPPYGGQFGHDLHPHMTVGEFASDAERQASNLPDYAPITFQTRRLHLIYGPINAALPWITYDVIPLKAPV